MNTKMKSFAVKTADEESEFHFEGYASTYENEDRDGDVMAKGCFDESVKKSQVIPMLFNHNRDSVIGKLEIATDEKGLFAKGTFNMNDDGAKNVYDLLKMGALTSMSIGFIVKDYEPIDKERPFGGWEIKAAEVVETSIVTVPANEQAIVNHVKSLSDVNNVKEFTDLIKQSVREVFVEEKQKEQKRAEILSQLNQ